MDTLRQDVRYALRALAKAKAFTAVAVLTLALGIGGNTAMFSVVNAVLLRPLPFAEPDRLVLVWGDDPRSGYDRLPLSYPNFADVRERTRAFAGLAVWTSSPDTKFSLTGGAEPETVQYAVASSDLFTVLGVHPSIGRTFATAEDRRGGDRGVMVSARLWHRRFGDDRRLAGKTLLLDGVPHTVVGVLPPDFRFVTFPREPDVWLPLGLDPFADRPYARGAAALGVLGRLAPGVTPDRARRELAGVAEALAREHPRFNTGWTLRLVPLREQVVGDVRPVLLVMLGAVGVVLLIACTNVAGLLLARASAREQELAVRAALGASRARLVRQMLTESALLALAGGAAGLLAGAWLAGVPAAVALGGASMFVPYRVGADQVSLDARVFAFTLGASLLASLLFGVLPALRASRVDPHDALRGGGAARATADARRQRLRGALVVSEIALALVLLVGAGLLARSLARLGRVDPGLRADNVLALDLTLSGGRYADAGRAAAFYRDLVERLAALPGVRAAAAVEQLPLAGPAPSTDLRIAGRGEPAPGQEPEAVYGAATPEYFRAMGVRLLRGRPLAPADGEHAPRVAVISAEMARRYWPDEDPLGKRFALSIEALRFDRPGPPRLDWAGAMREVVGVAADVRHEGLAVPPRPEVYLPLAQHPARDMTVVVRTDRDPLTLAAAARAQVRALDRDQPIATVQTMEAVVARSVQQPRSRALLLSGFAGLAVLLAAVGIYGVIAYGVAQRRRELGIRMALGAVRHDIVRLVVGQGMQLALAGVALGLAGAAAGTRVLAGLLFGVGARDAVTFAAVPAIVIAVAWLASYLPARRAARIDPMTAIRSE